MTVQPDTVLCRYHYDPLDRIASCAPPTQSSVQRFYRKDRLATEMQGQVQYSVFEHEAQLLAQQRHEAGRMATALLVTDLQRSVLHSVAAGQSQRLAYLPYGHRSPESGLISLLGFNGERRDSVTGHYLLGNGYRAFNPVLMRFNSPDSLSPFGKGGVNAYAYCEGDPVNRVDPTGHHFGVVLLSSITALQRINRGVDSVISVSTALVNSVGQGTRSTLNQAVAVVGDLRLNRVTWGEFSGDIQAFKKLKDTTGKHSEAISRFRSFERQLKAAENVADEALKKLELLKLNPGTKAPVGSTEYEKLINKPTMSAFQAARQVTALKQHLLDANIDVFRAHRNMKEAQVVANIRRGQ